MSPIYLGVDPGASGGLASISGREITYKPMPATERDLWDWFNSAWPQSRLTDHTCFAMIEKVGGYVGEAQPGSSAFKFGHNYGLLRMAMVATGIPFEEVTPQKWQRAMGISPRDHKRGETKTQFKNRLKAKAQQLFPNEKVTLAVADALLLAEYCRRLREGNL